ncbi:MAG: prolyl oligopeptidase family serine peptidase [Firmicutes bacterium]|nr:prolyl oligopeptidase family serine peptidase [Bacillota bacterium]
MLQRRDQCPFDRGTRALHERGPHDNLRRKGAFDVLAWTRWAVRRFGPEVKILLAGISMGASAVLMASELALPENVRGILADCPFSSPWDIIKKVGDARGFNMDIWRPFIKMEARIYGDFELDAAEPVTAVKHANVPILLIHGEDDKFVPCEMSRQIAEANPEMIEFHTFPGAGHGVSYLADTERYTKLVRDFCEKIFS